MRFAELLGVAELLLDVLLERLDDLLRAHAVGVDGVRDVAHHRLDLHPVRLLEHLDQLLALVAHVVAEDAVSGCCRWTCGLYLSGDECFTLDCARLGSVDAPHDRGDRPRQASTSSTSTRLPAVALEPHSARSRTARPSTSRSSRPSASAPQAAHWVRVAGPGHTPAQLATVAYRKHVRHVAARGRGAGLGGAFTAAPDLVALIWIQSRMIFYIAAAYGYDPSHPMRPGGAARAPGLLRDAGGGARRRSTAWASGSPRRWCETAISQPQHGRAFTGG